MQVEVASVLPKEVGNEKFGSQCQLFPPDPNCWTYSGSWGPRLACNHSKLGPAIRIVQQERTRLDGSFVKLLR